MPSTLFNHLIIWGVLLAQHLQLVRTLRVGHVVVYLAVWFLARVRSVYKFVVRGAILVNFNAVCEVMLLVNYDFVVVRGWILTLVWLGVVNVLVSRFSWVDSEPVQSSLGVLDQLRLHQLPSGRLRRGLLRLRVLGLLARAALVHHVRRVGAVQVSRLGRGHQHRRVALHEPRVLREPESEVAWVVAVLRVWVESALD